MVNVGEHGNFNKEIYLDVLVLMTAIFQNSSKYLGSVDLQSVV